MNEHALLLGDCVLRSHYAMDLSTFDHIRTKAYHLLAKEWVGGALWVGANVTWFCSWRDAEFLLLLNRTGRLLRTITVRRAVTGGARGV